MAPYALAFEKHWALYPGRSKVIAGPVSNSLVSHCHKYWTVPYPTWKPSIECCRISFFIEHIFFIAWKYQMLSNIYFFLSHESIKNIESNVLFYRTYVFYRMKLLKISNQMFCFIKNIFIAWKYWKHNSNQILIKFGRRRAHVAAEW